MSKVHVTRHGSISIRMPAMPASGVAAPAVAAAYATPPPPRYASSPANVPLPPLPPTPEAPEEGGASACGPLDVWNAMSSRWDEAFVVLDDGGAARRGLAAAADEQWELRTFRSRAEWVSGEPVGCLDLWRFPDYRVVEVDLATAQVTDALAMSSAVPAGSDNRVILIQCPPSDPSVQHGLEMVMRSHSSSVEEQRAWMARLRAVRRRAQQAAQHQATLQSQELAQQRRSAAAAASTPTLSVDVTTPVRAWYEALCANADAGGAASDLRWEQERFLTSFLIALGMERYAQQLRNLGIISLRGLLATDEAELRTSGVKRAHLSRVLLPALTALRAIISEISRQATPLWNSEASAEATEMRRNLFLAGLEAGLAEDRYAAEVAAGNDEVEARIRRAVTVTAAESSAIKSQPDAKPMSPSARQAALMSPGDAGELPPHVIESWTPTAIASLSSMAKSALSPATRAKAIGVSPIALRIGTMDGDIAAAANYAETKRSEAERRAMEETAAEAVTAAILDATPSGLLHSKVAAGVRKIWVEAIGHDFVVGNGVVFDEDGLHAEHHIIESIELVRREEEKADDGEMTEDEIAAEVAAMSSAAAAALPSTSLVLPVRADETCVIVRTVEDEETLRCIGEGNAKGDVLVNRGGLTEEVVRVTRSASVPPTASGEEARSLELHAPGFTFAHEAGETVHDCAVEVKRTPRRARAANEAGLAKTNAQRDGAWLLLCTPLALAHRSYETVRQLSEDETSASGFALRKAFMKELRRVRIQLDASKAAAAEAKKNALATSAKAIAAAEAEGAAQRNEIAAHRRAIEVHRQSIADLQAGKEELEASVEKHIAAKEAAVARHGNAETLRTELEAERDELAEKLSSLGAGHSEKAAQVDALQQKLARMEERIETESRRSSVALDLQQRKFEEQKVRDAANALALQQKMADDHDATKQALRRASQMHVVREVSVPAPEPEPEPEPEVEPEVQTVTSVNDFFASDSDEDEPTAGAASVRLTAMGAGRKVKSGKLQKRRSSKRAFANAQTHRWADKWFEVRFCFPFA